MSVPPAALSQAVQQYVDRGLTKKEIFTKFVGGVPGMEGKTTEEVGKILDDMDLEDFNQLLMYFIQREMDNVHVRKRLPEYDSMDIAVDLIRSRKKILVLTGAGISTSCGIPDFRSANGVYSMLGSYALDDPQDLFSISYFRRNVKPFYDFARKLWPGTHKPAPTHRFIRCIEQSGNILRNYTQNIDTLEHVCGSRKVLQCHGSFATATCTRCKYRCDGEKIKDDIMNGIIPMCPQCQENPKPSLAERFAMDLPELQTVRATHGSRASETLAQGVEDVSSPKFPQGPRDQQTRSVSSSFQSSETSEPSTKRIRVEEGSASNVGSTSPKVKQAEELSLISSPVLVKQPTPKDTGMPRLDIASNLDPSDGASGVAARTGHDEVKPELKVQEAKAQEASNADVGDANAAGTREETLESTGSSEKSSSPRASVINTLPFVDEFFDKGIMKPDIVFFGEQLPSDFFKCIETDVEECDLLIVMGTSLKVAPVSRVIELVNDNVPQILINREVVARPHEFDVELLGNCDQVSLELSRRLGWDIVTNTTLAEGSSTSSTSLETAPVSFERCGQRPYRYLFEGHCLSNDSDTDNSDSEEEEDEGESSKGDVQAPNGTTSTPATSSGGKSPQDASIQSGADATGQN